MNSVDLNSFNSNTTIKEINFPEITNTSFENMFYECSSLTKITKVGGFTPT